jgi:hypothetical protein
VDERYTKIFTERIVQTAIQFYTELRLKRSKDALDILSRRASSVKSSAKAAISSKAAIQDININPAQSMQSAVLQQKQLDVTANTGAYVEMYKNLEMANYQYLKDVPLLEIIDEPRYPMKKIKSGKLMTAIKWSLGAFLITCITLLLFKATRKKKALE